MEQLMVNYIIFIFIQLLDLSISLVCVCVVLKRHITEVYALQFKCLDIP